MTLPRTRSELQMEAKDKAQLQKIIKQLTDMIINAETQPKKAEETPEPSDGPRPRRGSGAVLEGGLLGEDNLMTHAVAEPDEAEAAA